MADLSLKTASTKALVIRGRVIDLKDPISQPVPHVGLNVLSNISISPLFERLNSRPHFYFDHRYHFVCEGEHQVALVTYERNNGRCSKAKYLRRTVSSGKSQRCCE